VQTWPRSIDDLPPMMDYDVRNGRTYMYFDGEPLYPFGFGLSYTTFDYANLRTSPQSLKIDGEMDVLVDVTNTGDRAGEEVVQLYVRHLESQVSRPRQELKGFVRIALMAGETRPVTFTLPAGTLSYWDAENNRFVVEPGQIELRVGGSSADVRRKKTIDVFAE
jgi:beta-glucosidase